ncbi:DedA family protein [Effusibacillus lacus]|uniref:DedA family protein n=1 Tax=Effusibacillus lacus TaxID=1348429 RepID=UPI0010D5F85B|nr:DedA family protein [Effusibacillus lacus]TCS74345.1 membrane protein DedA with SNARE-associated domain [Effusibacillus lacus]
MFESLWHQFLIWVHNAGYQGMGADLLLEGLGVPFPGDAVMAFYGYMISAGHFSYVQAVAWCAAGCWLGSIAAFFVGRTYGVGFLQRFGRFLLLRPKHVRETELLSMRYGVWILVFGRFLPGVRTLSSYFAGIGRMSWPTFLLMSLLGFAMWCAAWLWIGVWFGEHWDQILERINQLLLALVLLIIMAGFWWWKRN